MKVDICSRKDIASLKPDQLPKNTAVISFYTPNGKQNRVNYQGICERVFYVGIPDIDIERLTAYGYTYESYLSESDALADFIIKAVKDGCQIICQCDFGQSRSAACAAAILQHFNKSGIAIFADYRYYPNQLVFHKVLDALEKK